MTLAYLSERAERHLSGPRVATVLYLVSGLWISLQSIETTGSVTTGPAFVIETWTSFGTQVVANPVAGTILVASGLYLTVWFLSFGPMVR